MIKNICFFLATFVLTLNYSYAGQKGNTVERGNVIYCFETGKMQCQSEINQAKEITILLSSLKKNTEVKFKSITGSKNKLVAKVVMLVKDENPICASWTDMQEVNLAIDPTPVQAFTLTGEEIYNSKGVRVLLKK